MLKLDPDEAESDEEAREKLKLNSSIKADTSPTTSILPSIEPLQSLNEEGRLSIDNEVYPLTPNTNNKTGNYDTTPNTPIKVHKS